MKKEYFKVKHTNMLFVGYLFVVTSQIGVQQVADLNP